MIQELLGRLAKALTASHIPYMVIGGQAVLFYGYPRLTQDLDVTLGVGIESSGRVIAACRQIRLTPLVKQPQQFVGTTHVLPLEDRISKLRVDLVFADTPYEQLAIGRARRVRLGRTTIRIAAFEDLLIHKLVAGRPRDLDDVKVLLSTSRRKLDIDYVRKWLQQFADLELLPQDPLATFDRLRRASPA